MTAADDYDRTAHLQGRETPTQAAARHCRYLDMFEEIQRLHAERVRVEDAIRDWVHVARLGGSL